MPKKKSGNTNHGNTARKFFRHPEKTAEITGMELNLPKRLGIILECINCNMKINLEKFVEFTRVTQDIYLRNYSWYPMPISLHKFYLEGETQLKRVFFRLDHTLKKPRRQEINTIGNIGNYSQGSNPG
ncbi:hypothetical protein AVEN_258169-1 [Araneus ventricosus]|uniref:Uncharacterized protein n=1 Tax=Araneus ventricosus TaxID=182803 RepID=A0A4Y2GI46_ARAVE|nr:hypothetical protein AVEN_258169-1 [Araneus ventricosus]